MASFCGDGDEFGDMNIFGSLLTAARKTQYNLELVRYNVEVHRNVILCPWAMGKSRGRDTRKHM